MDFTRDILPLKNILFRTALRITMNREESEDIVQDTLLKLWERRTEMSKINNLEAFAISSVRNLALDRLALHQNKVISLNEDLHDTEDNHPSAYDNIINNERTSRYYGHFRIGCKDKYLPRKRFFEKKLQKPVTFSFLNRQAL